MASPPWLARDTGAAWISRLADEAVAEAGRRAQDGPVVCASRLTPSGPLHLGDLREVMTSHLVAEELRHRGHDSVHVLFWYDFERFGGAPSGIGVPAGTRRAWNEHIGKPLTSVPSPPWSAYLNWAYYFEEPMIAALADLGVTFRGASQERLYASGAVRERVLVAVRERARIGAALARHRTDPGAAATGSGTTSGAEAGSPGYFPYRPYCSACDRDPTTVTSYDDETTALAYTCACGHAETVRLAEHGRGRLAHEVELAVFWAHEGVVFEPSRFSPASPGPSLAAAGRIIREVFNGERPLGAVHAPVCVSGMARKDRSGRVPTPAAALAVMDPPLLRLPYVRHRPEQPFTIALGRELQRAYDEWDALAREVADGTAEPAEAVAYRRSAGATGRPLPAPPRPLPYHLLASVVNITAGDGGRILRVLHDLNPGDPVASLDELWPRLDRAAHWIAGRIPAGHRPRIRETPATGLLSSLGAAERASLRHLLDGLDENRSLDDLTALVYGVPKLQAGSTADAAPELKAAQRAFFALLYTLLLGCDSGPRLPALLLALGPDRVRRLLGA
ncbi:lysine--tRNA ligase [Planomonospora sp. ID67723]|uniref:lysine--tRNA ligase n=1 Tax=Planomonospora sp. ID67723 TaxID=2738134 RepID=UPI001A22D0D6|nr:lysine--tRNA ligase [Planomonospora sp. ID67723]MBG0831982.1 lysine--tRNA ligase [Planomonospora sp. ID67723]